MPMASMGELYGLPAQRGNPLLVPAQYNGPAALGRQMPLGTGPSVQALRSNNQASEAQQAMLMQVWPAPIICRQFSQGMYTRSSMA